MDRHASSRRRGQELEDALLDAAWEELAEVGYGRFTIEGVAARAGPAGRSSTAAGRPGRISPSPPYGTTAPRTRSRRPTRARSART
ncbi:TetR family transcriptional regulator [Actinoallomurus acanthiterrae]